MDKSLFENLACDYLSFKNEDLCFDISMRNYPTGEFSPIDYIRIHYPFLRLSQIKSIYGFHELFTPLYGGRSFNKAQVLTTKNLQGFYDHGINYYIPLSNHFIDEKSYEKAHTFLEMHHRSGNTVVCVSDTLAKWILRDFPQYSLSASVIKNLTETDAILRALEIYDSVVMPPTVNNNLNFLEKFKFKERLVLFANNGCRYTCPAWNCYQGISKGNYQEKTPNTVSNNISKKEYSCSKRGNNPIYREELGYIIFDLDIYYKMGYSHFKLIPPRPLGKTLQKNISKYGKGIITFFDSNGQKTKKQPVISKDIKYTVSQNFKGIFKNGELRLTIQKSRGVERKLFYELDSITPLFKNPLSVFQTIKVLTNRFSVSTNHLLSFFQTLIRHDLLIEVSPQFEKPVFIVSAPMKGNSLLFDSLSHIKLFWTIGDKSHKIIEAIPQLHPSYKRYDSNQLLDFDATPQIQRILIEEFTKHLKDYRGNPYLHLPYSEHPEKVRLLLNDCKSALRIPFFKKVFSDAKFIYLYQEPKSAINSIMEGWRSGSSVTYFNLPDWPIQRWSFLLPPGWRKLKNKHLSEIASFQLSITDKIVRRDLDNLCQNDWRLIRYEDFVKDPMKETAAICHFINDNAED